MSPPGGTPARRTVAAVDTTGTEASTEGSYLPPMLNPFEPGFFDDPYAQYRLVREQDPVHLSAIGAWALFRYEDVHRVLRDPHLSVEERHSNVTFDLDDEIRALLDARRTEPHNMLDLDPPD